MQINHHRLLFAGLAFLLLVGCQTTPPGQSARYDFLYSPKIPVTLPANAPSISQQYRKFDPRQRSHDQNNHTAIDIVAPEGTAVIAPADGVVRKVLTEPAYGKRIEISHGPDAQGRAITTQYFHLQSQAVRPGDTVQRGQKIGSLGHTGLLAGGVNHLHYSVARARDKYGPELVDPNLYWLEGPGQVVCFDPKTRYPSTPFLATYPVVCGQ